MFDTGVDGVRLCLHIGLGCGEAIQGIVVDTLKNVTRKVKVYVMYVWNKCDLKSIPIYPTPLVTDCHPTSGWN